MKGQVVVDYMEFKVPDFAQAHLPMGADGSIQYFHMALKDLPDDVLHALIMEWTRQVYEKADRRQPPTSA